MTNIKTGFFCLLSLLAGLAIGLMINFSLLENTVPKPTTPLVSAKETDSIQITNQGQPSGSQNTASSSDFSNNRVLLAQSFSILSAMKAKDFTTLATFVHPQKGVTFTPYSTVDFDANLNFSASAIAHAPNDPAEYIWGITDGKGDPIQLTIEDYFDKFVFSADFTAAPVIGIDRIMGSGNAIENVAQAYPEGRFVEFHFPGLVEANHGMDWCSLKLVFEWYNGSPMLVGLIHSQWTI